MGDQVFVYLQSETTLWTVGFYKPDGEWEAASDHSVEEEAAERVAWLNGGGSRAGEMEELRNRIKALEDAARATYDRVAAIGGGY
jgi:hypothetical protein